jgi:hypothetical protein
VTFVVAGAFTENALGKIATMKESCPYVFVTDVLMKPGEAGRFICIAHFIQQGNPMCFTSQKKDGPCIQIEVTKAIIVASR